MTRADTVVRLGFAMLLRTAGAAAPRLTDVAGISVAAPRVDAEPARLAVPVRIGPACDHRTDPKHLATVSVRLGGATVGNCGTGIEIDSRGVIAVTGGSAAPTTCRKGAASTSAGARAAPSWPPLPPLGQAAL